MIDQIKNSYMDLGKHKNIEKVKVRWKRYTRKILTKKLECTYINR